MKQIHIAAPGLNVWIFKNPSQNDLTIYSQTVPQIRGTITDDDLYIWDAYDATHNEVDQHLPGEYVNCIWINAFGLEFVSEKWSEGYIGEGPNFEICGTGSPDIKNHSSILRLIN